MRRQLMGLGVWLCLEDCPVHSSTTLLRGDLSRPQPPTLTDLLTGAAFPQTAAKEGRGGHGALGGLPVTAKTFAWDLDATRSAPPGSVFGVP